MAFNLALPVGTMLLVLLVVGLVLAAAAAGLALFCFCVFSSMLTAQGADQDDPAEQASIGDNLDARASWPRHQGLKN